jgi:hypothetical protein
MVASDVAVAILEVPIDEIVVASALNGAEIMLAYKIEYSSDAVLDTNVCVGEEVGHGNS